MLPTCSPSYSISSNQSCSLFLLVALLLVTACAPLVSVPHLVDDETIELFDVPFYPQQTNQCGPAALAMLLGATGIEVHPETLEPLVYLPERRGSLQLDLIAACRIYGRIPYVIEPNFSTLIREIQGGHPVLVLQNFGLESFPAFHYAVVIGFEKNGVILRSGTTNRLKMDAAAFLMSWKRSGSWGLVALRPGEMPAVADPGRYIATVSAFEKSGQMKSAELAYRAALKTWPEHETAMFALGNNYQNQGKTQRAERVFRDILRENRNHFAAANNLAESFSQRGCFAAADALLTEAISMAEDSNSRFLPYLLQTRKENQRRHKGKNDSSTIEKPSETPEIFVIDCLFNQKQAL